MRSLALAILCCMCFFAVPASATLVDMSYHNGSLSAEAQLDVVNGQAIAGSGKISGGGLIGTLPMNFIYPNVPLPPLDAVPSADCIPGALGCYDVGTFSCGCNFVANDTGFNIGAVIPVDVDGIAFQVGGPIINYGFSLYDAGDGSVGEILVGNQSPQPNILNAGTAGGTLQYSVVPEPASFGPLSVGLLLLGLVLRRTRTRLKLATQSGRPFI
jgi:hypothetical protein